VNTNKITIATTATAVAVAIAIGVAPLLSPSAYAVKTVTPEECVGDPQGRDRCPGESGGNNPNREQQECEVTGGGGQTVQGQQKKICG
jgi:hypothetical protein